MRTLTSAIMITGTILLCSSTVVLAQESTFPEVCASSKTPPMMHSDTDMASMKGYQKEAMEGMQMMDQNMMQGMMKDDADVAFV